MEEIIEPISKELLKAELTEDKRLRMTNKSNNQIYIITASGCSQCNERRLVVCVRLLSVLLVEVQACQWILMNTIRWIHPYKQLIVWNPEAEEILGGYRYLLGTDVRFDEQGAPILATAHMFNFSDAFIERIPAARQLSWGVRLLRLSISLPVRGQQRFVRIG